MIIELTRTEIHGHELWAKSGTAKKRVPSGFMGDLRGYVQGQVDNGKLIACFSCHSLPGEAWVGDEWRCKYHL